MTNVSLCILEKADKTGVTSAEQEWGSVNYPEDTQPKELTKFGPCCLIILHISNRKKNDWVS